MDSTSFQSILAAVKRKREEEGGDGAGVSAEVRSQIPAPPANDVLSSSDTLQKDSRVVDSLVDRRTPAVVVPVPIPNAIPSKTADTNTNTRTTPNQPKSYREIQNERRERILSNKGKVENSKTTTHVQRKFEKYKKIIVSKSQTGNPLLKHLKIEYSINVRDLDVDYGINSHCYAVYLTLSYHNTNPGYIENRLRRIRNDYDPTRIRVLLLVVDITNHEKPIRDLSKLCILENMTMLVAWSPNEAANYINYLKQCEAGVGKSIIRGMNSANDTKGPELGSKLRLSNDIVESLTSIRSINKTNAISLVSKYGSMGDLVQKANEVDLGEVQGMGKVKVHDFLRVVHEPFVVKRG